MQHYISLAAKGGDDDSAVIAAISSFIRAIDLEPRLRAFQGAERPHEGSSLSRAPRPHPDALKLLQFCWEYRPYWRRLSLKGARALYRQMLTERAMVAVWRRQQAEPSDVIEEARSRLLAHRISGEEDDPRIVWGWLGWQFPDAAPGQYTPQQIRRAWRWANRMRVRSDEMGLQRRKAEEQVSLDSEEVVCHVVRRSSRPSDRLVAAEMVYALCHRQPSLVLRFARERLAHEGDWPEDLLTALLTKASAECRAEPRKLSSDQEDRCRRKLRRRLRRITDAT